MFCTLTVAHCVAQYLKPSDVTVMEEPQIFRYKTIALPVNFKVKVTPLHAIKGTERSSVIVLLILNLSARRKWVVKATPRPLYPRKNSPGIHCSERYVGPRAGLEGYGEERISSPTGVRTPDSPVRSLSLYAQRCPDPFTS
jgi:hypothetical protein